MTKEERAYMKGLERRVQELEVELTDAKEELRLEQEVTEGLHREVEGMQRKLRNAHRLNILPIARSVHEFFYAKGLAPGDIPWKCAPTAWRAELLSVLEPFMVDCD